MRVVEGGLNGLLWLDPTKFVNGERLQWDNFVVGSSLSRVNVLVGSSSDRVRGDLMVFSMHFGGGCGIL